jgi:hypothetical protein
VAADETLTRVGRALGALANALAELRRAWALVGGLAVSARAEPRFTRDADAAVSVSGDEDAEGLVLALGSYGFRPLTVVEQEAVGRLATVRLASPGEPADAGVVVDLLFASSGIEAEIAAAAETLEVVPGLTLPVARVGHLLVLKALSRSPNRPQDDADIRALVAVAQEQDWLLARAGARLVMQRGFGRGRDLSRLVDEIVDQGRG